MIWAYEKGSGRYQIRKVEGMHSIHLADVADEFLVARIVTLLNRHGLEDVPLDDPDAAAESPDCPL